MSIVKIIEVLEILAASFGVEGGRKFPRNGGYVYYLNTVLYPEEVILKKEAAGPSETSGRVYAELQTNVISK